MIPNEPGDQSKAPESTTIPAPSSTDSEPKHVGGIIDEIRARWEAMPRPTPEEVEATRQAQARQALVREEADRRQRWRAMTATLGGRYGECTLKGFQTQHEGQQAVVETLLGYCSEMQDLVKQGQGVVLYGPKGTGKDHLLAALLRAAVLQYGIACRWENGQDLFGDIRDRMETDASESSFVRSLVYPQVLAISDPLPVFGELTPHQANMLFRIIDRRYRENKPTWVTLNTANGSDAESRIGAQIVDRLRDGALAIACNWPSYRKPR